MCQKQINQKKKHHFLSLQDKELPSLRGTLYRVIVMKIKLSSTSDNQELLRCILNRSYTTKTARRNVSKLQKNSDFSQRSQSVNILAPDFEIIIKHRIPFKAVTDIVRETLLYINRYLQPKMFNKAPPSLPSPNPPTFSKN